MSDTAPRTAILGSSPADLHAGRTSAKWEGLTDDVLPMWVAEMDSHLAQPIADALHAAVERSDTGYAAHDSELPTVFGDFARRRWGWSVTQKVIPFTDVGVAITDTLRHLCRPGDGVILNTPVYPSFFSYFDAVGVRAMEVPLVDIADGGRLDLDGIDAAMRAGARALLLANPHNPTGTVHSRADLTALAELAERHGVRVISDEIHAPLTFAGTEFTPYLAVAGDTAVAAHSASKGWNIAGLKCGLLVGADLPTFSDQVAWAVGHFGVIASIAAYRDSEAWLDQLIGELTHNTEITAALLADTLPEIGYRPGAASYFAWLDCRRLDLGADPADAILDRARVKVSDGASFGGPGVGWIRMNIGTSPEIISTALGRIAALR